MTYHSVTILSRLTISTDFKSAVKWAASHCLILAAVGALWMLSFLFFLMVTLHVALLLPAFAVMVTVPGFFGVTTPSATEAMLVLEDVHFTAASFVLYFALT